MCIEARATPEKRAEGAKSVREMQSAARARLFTAVDRLQGVGVEVGGGWSHMLQTRFSQAEGSKCRGVHSSCELFTTD